MSAVKRSLNVGVVGLGRMGTPIARNLAFKSRTALYLQLHSRRMARASKVADDISRDGAQCAMRLHDRLGTMTKWCDVVVASLPDAEASRTVFLERDDALLRNARQGQIFVDHTTTDVETARECAAQAARRGATYLDCPISGSPDTAAAGTLTLMCGGDQDAFHRVLALLRLYGENVQHMGGSGSGAATKIICQSLVAMHTVAAAEAVSMAGAMGVDDMSKVFNVVDASWGASTMLRRCSPLMERYARNPEMTPDPSPTSIDTVLRDIRLIGQTTELRPEAFPVFAKTHNIFARASTAGVGDRDIAGVVHFLESDGPADPLAAPAAPALAAPSGSSSTIPRVVGTAAAAAVSAAGAAAGATSISAEALMDSLGDDVADVADVAADNAICDVAEAQDAAAASSQPALEEELEFY